MLIRFKELGKDGASKHVIFNFDVVERATGTNFPEHVKLLLKSPIIDQLRSDELLPFKNSGHSVLLILLLEPLQLSSSIVNLLGSSASSGNEAGGFIEFRGDVGRYSAFGKALSLHLPLVSNILSETRGGVCNVLATNISRGKTTNFNNTSDNMKLFLKIDGTLEDGKFGNMCKEFRGHDC